MLYDALYARQSIEKQDSISVESQLEYCRYETHGEPYLEYTDRGFSGKDTHRPGFERMTADIEAGKIRRVIVYKLDRISRSILDFANMMELFQQHQVEFVSSTEKFDTSTPIGRAMLNICIVFAQLERETIQKRVADAYYARSKRGFYMGGRIPYGYRLKETVIEQVRTSMFEEVPEESGQLKLIFSMYADRSNSLGDIVRYLNGHGIEHLRGSSWNTARLSEMLRNPVYVKADIDVYCFYKSQGAKIHNSIEDFTGDHACYLYSGGNPAGESGSSPASKEVVLAPHRGFIASEIWLACRMRCLGNRQSAQSCKPKNSWLSGKLKCGNCGYALTVRKSKTRWGRYFVCSCSCDKGACCGTGCTVYADVLEEYMSGVVRDRLEEFEVLLEHTKNCDTRCVVEKKIRMAQIEEETERLLSKVAGANENLMDHISTRIEKLDEERKHIQKELERENVPHGKRPPVTDHAERWADISFEDRQAVIDILIRVIRIADGKLEIVWNI